MFKKRFFNVLAAMLIAAGTVMAQVSVDITSLNDAAAIQSAIQTAIDGNTAVNVSGTATDIDAGITLNIPAGKTVEWIAEFTGSTTGGATQLINLTGAGIFAVSSGRIEQTGTGNVINNGLTGAMNVSGGTVRNTAATTAAIVINNASTGTVNVSAGTVSAVTGTAINNASTGTVNVSGGTVQNTGANVLSRLIVNASTGAVNISGGTVSAGSQAIRNISTGLITISNADASVPTLISSGNVNAEEGTIVLVSSGTTTDPRLIITGGTVRNTGNSANARAITNSSTGAVNISGGTVSATTGMAINNTSIGVITISQANESIPTLITSANAIDNAGTVVLANSGSATAPRLIITGGTVRNTGNNANARAITNLSTGAVNISGGTISVAALGTAINNASTGEVSVISCVVDIDEEKTIGTINWIDHDFSEDGEEISSATCQAAQLLKGRCIYCGVDSDEEEDRKTGIEQLECLFVAAIKCNEDGTICNRGCGQTEAPRLICLFKAATKCNEDGTPCNLGCGQTTAPRLGCLFKAATSCVADGTPCNRGCGQTTAPKLSCLFKAATSCVADGTPCNRGCGQTTAPKLACDWNEFSEWNITLAASCDAKGSKTRTRTCKREATHTDTQTEEIPQLTGEACQNANSIVNIGASKGSATGIRFAVNPVSDRAEISVVLPGMRATEAVAPTVVIYDMTGNVVFECRGDCPQSPANNGTIVWDLRNKNGRFVANGTYLVVVEAKDRNGAVYRYSARLGVNR